MLLTRHILFTLTRRRTNNFSRSKKFISLVIVDHIKRKLGRLLAINFDGNKVLGCSVVWEIEREIRKRISTLRYLFLDSLFSVFWGNPKKKKLEKLFFRTAVLHGCSIDGRSLKERDICSRKL